MVGMLGPEGLEQMSTSPKTYHWQSLHPWGRPRQSGYRGDGKGRRWSGTAGAARRSKQDGVANPGTAVRSRSGDGEG